MWTSVRWVLAGILLAGSGCAGQAGAPPTTPEDVSGVWSGTITIASNSVLRCCGALSGAAQVELTQDGESVSGSLDAPGFQGHITAFVRGATVGGYINYRAGMTAGSGRFDATVAGNEMVAKVLDSKLILSRVR